MTEEFEPTTWSKVSWDCPECGGILEPKQAADDVYGWEPVVRCYACGTVFDIDFESRDRSDS